jgi:hypothetical protein
LHGVVVSGSHTAIPIGSQRVAHTAARAALELLGGDESKAMLAHGSTLSLQSTGSGAAGGVGDSMGSGVGGGEST